jgi:hypothetical protein
MNRKKIFKDEHLILVRDYLIEKGFSCYFKEGWLFVTANDFDVLVDDLDIEIILHFIFDIIV